MICIRLNAAMMKQQKTVVAEEYVATMACNSRLGKTEKKAVIARRTAGPQVLCGALWWRLCWRRVLGNMHGATTRGGGGGSSPRHSQNYIPLPSLPAREQLIVIGADWADKIRYGVVASIGRSHAEHQSGQTGVQFPVTEHIFLFLFLFR